MLAAASEGGEPSGGGDEVSLTVAQWAAGMTAALQLDLPWRLLQPMLAPCSLDGRIDLEAFLSNSLPTDGADGRTAGAGGGGGAGDDGAGAEGAGASAAVTHELLFSRRQVLLACLGRMHVDSEGRFSLEQLGTICRLMGAKLPAEKSLFSQPETILQLLGLTPDPAGTIEVSEFVEAFHAKAVALAAERAAPLPPFALAEDRHASPLGGGKGLSIGSGITSKLDSKPPLRRLGGMGGRRSLMSGTPAGGTGEGSLC